MVRHGCALHIFLIQLMLYNRQMKTNLFINASYKALSIFIKHSEK
jgi:hypothetical protein